MKKLFTTFAFLSALLLVPSSEAKAQSSVNGCNPSTQSCVPLPSGCIGNTMTPGLVNGSALAIDLGGIAYSAVTLGWLWVSEFGSISAMAEYWSEYGWMLP